ncbi:ABC transporter, permease protein [Treponema phagedenis F0421]|uniref:carbohydrate ABC transporter permease n=1 Tax=Treponema phagedenis TaxID=162 RepID=UPI0001F6414E|nr:carbohydrate ABC transporter permease [Treponema phagedenis]EFW38397.1 ABC transporter, permease protein [Treponema phagedenis F0421]
MKAQLPNTKKRYKIRKKLRRAEDALLQIFIVAIVLFLCASIILPCLNIIALAFNDGADAARGGVYFFPRVFTLDNFKEVFKDGQIIRAYGITIARTVICTVLSIWLITMTAFVLKIRTLPGRTFFTMAIALTMLFSGGLIPTYIQYKNLGLLNSFWVYIIPGVISAYYLFMVRTFFETIPYSLEESAMIDGCNYVGIYTRIILPLSKPVIAVIGLYTAVGHWNDWFAGAFYMNSSRLWPVQTVLQQMLRKAMAASKEGATISQLIAAQARAATSDSLKMAAVVITMLPILCVYPFIQKYFAKGVMIGSVKG